MYDRLYDRLSDSLRDTPQRAESTVADIKRLRAPSRHEPMKCIGGGHIGGAILAKQLTHNDVHLYMCAYCIKSADPLDHTQQSCFKTLHLQNKGTNSG